VILELAHPVRTVGCANALICERSSGNFNELSNGSCLIAPTSGNRKRRAEASTHSRRTWDTWPLAVHLLPTRQRFAAFVFAQSPGRMIAFGMGRE
jgi:hypothetical protein